MRSKRLLTLLLAVCLVMSCVFPAAATTVGSETAGSAEASQTEENAKNESDSKLQNDRLVSNVSGNRVQTLRDNTDHVISSGNSQTQTESGESGWTVTPSDTEISVSIRNTEIPQSVLELREMEEEYSGSDIVRAFVVMEEEPLIQTYSSFDDIPQDVEEMMEQLQEAIIEAIEEQVLNGETLDVQHQFTWLTNAFSISTEFGNLEEIAYIDGVESVFVMPTYQVCEEELQSVAVPYTTSATEMTGVNAAWDLGYTGSGMTIAIIDTGLDLDHPSFAADPEDPSMDVGDIAAVLEDLNAYAYAESNNIALTAEQLYRSAKVPFAFCYVDADLDATHDKDNEGYHGTHVAGIAAANDVEGSGVIGMAPDAQLVIMKVFGNNGGAYMDDIAAALEDAAKLGCDVANLSLGSPAGFGESAYDFINEIYENLAKTDIIVNISAGNEGTSSYDNLWGTNLNTTDNMDNATVGSPSTYANVNSIASVDNNKLSATAIVVDGEYFMYNDGLGLAEMRTIALDDSGEVKTYEYVMVPGLGEASNFEGLNVAGKIAVIARGTINFSEKLANAEAAGAVGVIITNNVDGSISSFGMSFEDDNGNLAEGISGNVPAILVSKKTGEALEASESKTLTICPENVVVEDEGGGQVSTFSSWGVTPDLRLLPDLAGIGGNVYSTYDDGQYGYMSGTSMASPQVAGVSALVVEYLKEALGVADENIREMVDALLMSTADPVISSDTGLEASPRQQGAGLVNALNALTSGAYVTVDATETNKPKAELGDNAEGVFTFTFTVHNFSDEAKTFTLGTSGLLTEAVDPSYLPYGLYFMAGYETELDGDVSFSAESVTVPAGGTADVTVTVSVSGDGKAWLAKYYPNGGYVEGYVYLTNADENGVDLSLPFLGFCGDWTDAPVFDTAYWYDNSFWGATNSGIDGNQYFHVMWTDLDGNDWVLGMNPYSGAYEDEEGNIVYDPDNNVISNNGDGVLDEIVDMYISLMRNAKYLTFTYAYADEEENVLFEETVTEVSKTMYISAYGQVVPYLYSWYTEQGNYDFTDADGNPLPSGTKLTLTISGTLDYKGAEADTIVIPITLDTNAPVVDADSLMTHVLEDGSVYVTFTVTDESSLAAVYLMNPAGTQIYSDGYDPVKNEDGTYSIALNITDLGTEFLLVLADYGCNESYYSLSFKGELPDGNKPEMDPDALYAYRVYDAAINDDSLYGWITIDKETAETTQLTNDQREYYALTAAEYAGGYVFAVDAGHNFLVMEPGLWNRTTICNLGTGVLDMTFSKKDQTMYVTTKGTDEYGDTVYGFGTVDLLTGELNLIATSSSAYDMPYAMAATDDGTIYAVKYYNSGLYTVDTETGTLTAVTDADGNAIKLTRQGGSVVYPYYNQSMTYSSADEVIYWSFFTYTNDAELFTINVSGEVPTWSSVEFPVDAECVGLLTLDEDDYVLPEAEAISSLILNPDSLLMIEGESTSVSVNVLPWNYEPSEAVTWESSDASVATVNANGVVTAVSEGYATITATCEDVSAQCDVTVVHVEGTVYAYDYYNGTGVYEDWIAIDLGSMTYESLGQSPVDFLAADYNGHDGNIYGYDINGQFYRFNPETGACDALGTPVASVPTDMAYDYSTGFMYAMTIDQNAWTSTLCYVNMRTGALVEVATAYDIFMTLACDTDGNLFAMSYDGVLFYLYLYGSESGGGEVMPLSDEEVTMSVEPQYIMEGFGTLNYAQSMCWDHNNGVLIWAYPEASVMLWIDIYEGYVLNLGDPTGSGLFQFVGLYTIPDEIEELPYVPVQSVSADDMLLMVGGSKLAGINVNPLNATNQDVTWVSSDETIATVDENGLVTGVSIGVTTITGTLVDGENSFDFSFTVNVKQSADQIFGYIASDLATGGGQAWASIPDSDPTKGIEYLEATDYMIYAEEYYNGKIYAYGYDSYDWEANFQFMVIDPTTYLIESMTDMGGSFPFVYDMTFDYTTGTMYAVAGYNSSSSDLYMVNLDSGKLVPCMSTEPFFMSIAAGSDGTLYGIAASESYFDEETWTDVFEDAKLYTFDVAAGTYTELFSTGVKSNMLQSMAFDHDTGNLYWTPLFRASYWDPMSGGMYLIDLEEQQCYNLGNIGAAGSQVTGLYIVADEFPEVPDYLVNIFLTSTVEQMGVGESLTLEAFVQPFGYHVEPVWSSSDESVATVDENGNVTAVGAGVATVTVTVVDGEKTFTSSCAIIVYGEDDYFLTYDRTQDAFAMVSRMDLSNVTILESAAQEEQADIRAMAMADGVLYGYDVDNGFFTTDKKNQRTYLGEATGIDLQEDTDSYDYYYEVRDMAWDAANERMLAVVCKSVLDLDYDWVYELMDGCLLCQVDLSTGALTELATFCTSSGDSISNVYTLAVTDDGVVYSYSSFMDYVFTVDVETGVVTDITTLQNQGVYGDSDGNPMAMEYDPITCNIYMLFTQNGRAYQMVFFNTTDKSLNVLDYIGEFDADYYETNLYAGLVIDAEHVHAWTPIHVITEPTCTEDGLGEHDCLICGEHEEVVLEALGHDWNVKTILKKDKCTDLGYTISKCERCGKVEHNWDMPHSHSYETSTDSDGNTVHTCTECGYSYTEKKVDNWWDKLFPWLGGWWK